MGGCILRGVLTESEQQWLYEQLHGMPDPQCDDLNSLRQTAAPAIHAQMNPENKPQPLAVWCHPYTRESTARRRPKQLLAWAEKLMHALAPDTTALTIDSMLAQLYAPGGALKKHRDADLSWGIIVSLGCDATLSAWASPDGEAQQVTFQSGDVVVAEFGLMPHQVEVSRSPPPPWWSRVEHFGTQRRCSVLFRQALTKREQRRLADERAMKLHGMPVAEVSKRTGQPEDFLTGLLCKLHGGNYSSSESPTPWRW